MLGKDFAPSGRASWIGRVNDWKDREADILILILMHIVDILIHIVDILMHIVDILMQSLLATSLVCFVFSIGLIRIFMFVGLIPNGLKLYNRSRKQQHPQPANSSSKEFTKAVESPTRQRSSTPSVQVSK